MSDFDAYQRDSRPLRFTVLDDVTGEPMDLTGYTVTWVLMSSPKGTPPVVKSGAGGRMMAQGLVEVLRKASPSNITISDATGGVFEFTLSVADTENLVGPHYYEAFVVKAGVRSTVVTGVITFMRTVA